MTNIQNCGVIGVGFVGATCAYSLAVSGLFSELVLVDMNRDEAIGEAADSNHGVAFSKPCRVRAGDYADLAECGLIIIAAGANQKPGESRLELLGRNKGILSSVIAQLTAVNREAILLVVSNPVDVLTCLAQQLSGLDVYKRQVEEAIFLSGRVLVVEDTPIRKLHSFEVPAPYPRTRACLTDPNTAGQENSLLYIVSDEQDGLAVLLPLIEQMCIRDSR